MQEYTIRFARFNQNNLNFLPFEFEGAEAFNETYYSSFEDVLAHSITAGYIKNIAEARCFCDGNDDVEPYFTANTPAEECETYLSTFQMWTSENWEEGEEPTFESDICVYNFYQ